MHHLKLMYITNDPTIAQIAEVSGVDRVFIDMEYVGKALRQGGMDTVQSHHTFQDVRNIRSVLRKAELLVRCNPIHEAGPGQIGSKAEIDNLVACGADIIMLPYFKTAEDVKTFLALVAGRVRTMLLFETKEAVANASDILALPGIDEVYIGFNDLSLSYGYKFMFQPLAEGLIDTLCDLFRQKALPYGFGGIAAIGKGMIPAEKVLAEHYRLGSTCAILSRSFCNISNTQDFPTVETLFKNGVAQIRQEEDKIAKQSADFLEENHRDVCECVHSIVNN